MFLLRKAVIDPNWLSSEEKRLLDKWANSIPGFIRDGCANPKNYVNAPVKLLFILKEVNGRLKRCLIEVVKNLFEKLLILTHIYSCSLHASHGTGHNADT